VKFVKKFFSNLNRELLESLDDGKIIILNDPDEEKEDVRDEDTADTEAVPYSAVKSLAPTASATDADDVDKGCSPD
jgi:hypothetical protein